MGAARTTVGRTDQTSTVLTARTKARLTMAGMAALVLAAWHLAVVFTRGVGLGQVSVTVRALLTGNPLAGLPGTSTTSTGTVLVVFGITAAALFVASLAVFYWAIVLTGRVRRRGRGGKGLATKAQITATVGEARIRKDAAQTFPSMTDRERAIAPIEALAFVMGTDQRSKAGIAFGFNDNVVVLGPAGAGKSVSIMEPAALEAPGALILTSNEVGILDTIVATRRKLGRVWVFDPLNRSAHPEPMVWDAVAGCQDGETALARGEAFVAGCGADDSSSTNASFFKRNAAMALRAFLHAAALDGRTMADVLAWSAEISEGASVPKRILSTSVDPRAEKQWIAALDAVSTGAEQTVASSRNTLAQVVDPLTLSSVNKWVIPRAGVPTFVAADFVRSTDTLVLLSDDSSSTNVGPLCTMLLQEVIDAIKAYAPFTVHGRIEPPIRIVGDEIANIAPVTKLPEIVTEVRKLGVQTMLAFQDDLQATTRWGESRGRTLLSQMAAEVVLPGIKSTTALTRYSDLTGQVEVLELSMNHDQGGERTGTSTSTQTRPALRADEIRTMADGQALVIWRNAPAMVVTLQPWYQRSYGKQVTASRAAASAARRAARDQAVSHGVAGSLSLVKEPLDEEATA